MAYSSGKGLIINYSTTMPDQGCHSRNTGLEGAIWKNLYKSVFIITTY